MTDEQLRNAAAALSGRYDLDFVASPREGYIEVSATLACLKDIRDDLRNDAEDVDLSTHPDVEYAGVLFIKPGDEQLEELLAIEREARPEEAGTA